MNSRPRVADREADRAADRVPVRAALRVAVLGARGRFGSAACEAIERDGRFELVGRFGREDDWTRLVGERRVDVALEATRAGQGAAHGLELLARGVRVVIATSGVDEVDEARLDRLARERGLGGLIVPNFSLGAALLMRAAESLAPYFPAIEIVEMHHEQKLDAPSGTARETARRLAAARERSGAGGRAPIPIHSLRLPGRTAHQEVHFGAPGENLVLRHDVSSPEAYAPGIVAALVHAARCEGVSRGIERALDLPTRGACNPAGDA